MILFKGNTYANECQLRKKACINEMDLRALFYGECDDANEAENGDGGGVGIYVFPDEVGSGEASEDESEIMSQHVTRRTRRTHIAD